MARFASRALLVSVAVFATFGIAVASADSPTITGYPVQMNQVDLTGYTIQTTYTLGRNALPGVPHSYIQTYTSSNTVQAGPVGAGCLPNCFSTHYTATPVANNMVMVTWFNGGGDLPAGTITDVFVFNFQTGVVSDVAPDPDNGPESLGTVKILVKGGHPIPPGGGKG